MNIILGAQQQGIIIKSHKEIDIMRRAGEVAIGTKEIIKNEMLQPKLSRTEKIISWLRM